MQIPEANVDRVFAFYLSWAIEKMDKKELIKAADSTLTKNPKGKDQIVFIENHDTRRLASVNGMTNEKLKVAAALNLLLGGIPLIYYGQELGMKGKQLKGPTDGNDIPIREAFEWNADANGKGMALWYKNTGPWWDSTHVKPNDGISLEEERRDTNSLWNYYKKIIRLKKSIPALAHGTYLSVANENDHIFSFLRTTDTDRALVIVNLSGSTESVKIKLTVGSVLNLLSGTLKKLDGTSLSATLQPYEVLLYKLK